MARAKDWSIRCARSNDKDFVGACPFSSVFDNSRINSRRKKKLVRRQKENTRWRGFTGQESKLSRDRGSRAWRQTLPIYDSRNRASKTCFLVSSLFAFLRALPRTDAAPAAYRASRVSAARAPYWHPPQPPFPPKMPPKKKPEGKTASAKSRSTVGSCLRAIGVGDPGVAFAECAVLDDEFRMVKKAYHRVVLTAHPDKGGDRETFELVQDAFETLRTMMQEGKITSFADVATAKKSATKEFAEAKKHRPTETPSWEFYRSASTEGFPIYKVDLAVTARSACDMKNAKTYQCPFWDPDVPEKDWKTKQCKIPKGEVRISSLDMVSGAYGRFVHLSCWRVPGKVSGGLPDPQKEKNPEAFKKALLAMDGVLLTGLKTIPDDKLDLIVPHVMNKKHWARVAVKKKVLAGSDAPATADDDGPALGGAGKGKAVPVPKAVPKRAATVPVPAPQPKRAKVGKGKAAPVINLTDDLDDDSMDEDDLPISLMQGAKGGKKIKGAKLKPKTEPKVQKGFADGVVGRGAMVVSKRASKPVILARKQKITAMTIPRPGVGLAVPSALLGKTVVLTGLFPELGGGYGLDLGKAKARALIESFGGRVTSAISGKTDVLLTGSEPGMSKVGQARNKGVTLMTLSQLTEQLGSGLGMPEKGTADAQDFTEKINIQSFSAGYLGKGGLGNGLALSASAEELAFAASGAGQVGTYAGECAPRTQKPKAKPRNFGGVPEGWG